MAKETPYMSLKQATLNTKGGFTPVVHKPDTVDFRDLSQGLSEQQAITRQLGQGKATVNLNFGKIKEQLHEDEETNQWYNRLKADYENQIQNEIDAGNPNAATALATELGTKMFSDEQYIKRKKANENYTKAIDALNNRNDLDQDTKDWAKATGLAWEYNPDALTPTFDWKPVTHINDAELERAAVQIVSEDRQASGNSSSSHSGSNYSNTNVEGTSRGGSSSTTKSSSSHLTTAQKQESRIWNAVDGLIASNRGYFESIQQEKAVAEWKYYQLRAKKDSGEITNPQELAKLDENIEYYESKLYDDKGKPKNSIQYFHDRIAPLVKESAYHNVTRETSSSFSHETGSNVNNYRPNSGSGSDENQAALLNNIIGGGHKGVAVGTNMTEWTTTPTQVIYVVDQTGNLLEQVNK